MKGKYAARSENRRVTEATSEIAELRATIKQEREDSKTQILALEAETRRLRADHLAEAARLAAEEVKRRIADAEQERRGRGMSDDITMHLMYEKDRFIMNACRYLSMTKGQNPLDVLPTVLTWATDKDIYGVTGVDFLIKLGVAGDGWVARTWKRFQHDERRMARQRRAIGRPAAISLDRAAEEGHPDIHSKYNPAWYPRVDYQGIELADEPEAKRD